MRSSTGRPSRPPAALTCASQSWRPFAYPAARSACPPDCDTTAPTTIGLACPNAANASAARLIVQLVVNRMAAHRDERGALEGHEYGAIRLLAGGAHRDDAVVRARVGFALADHFRLGVDRVAGENRRGEADLVPAEVG